MKELNKETLVLLGAICGDIIGSAYERASIKNIPIDFPLFTYHSRFTDDSVCTIAIADALINDKPIDKTLQNWCRKYPNAGYAGRFRQWIESDRPRPYNSWGNGSAMRVSSVGVLATSENDVLSLAKATAEVTHNHPEGIKGAQATALAIYLAFNGSSKNDIKTELETRFGYDLSRKYADIQPTYRFDVSCQGSVPEAIIAFLESDSYESAIRLAVALGGDTDTQAAIAGGIAAAFYKEIPENILFVCNAQLGDDMKEFLNEFALKGKTRFPLQS